jgi:hypothetical protein
MSVGFLERRWPNNGPELFYFWKRAYYRRMPGAKDYQKDFERMMAPLEEKQDRQQERAVKDLIAMAKQAGIWRNDFPPALPRLRR